MDSRENGGRIELPKPDGYRCFGCGTVNPCGLNMDFYCVGTSVRSDIVLSEHHVGWENIAHGGIISTVLDEIMGWTVLAFKRLYFVTRSMEVRYLRPVQVNTPLTAIGEIDQECSVAECSVHGTLVDAKGAKMAVARAEMVFLAEKRLPLLPAGYRKDMGEIFEQMKRLLG